MERNGILIKDVCSIGGEKYKKDTRFTFVRIKELDDDGKWMGTFRIISTFKCNKNVTHSGLHTFDIFADDFYEPK